MDQEMINNLLAKLKEKTGRNWTVSDLAQLARMLPRLNERNIDAVLQELGKMGLDVNEGTRKKLKQSLQQEQQQTLKLHADSLAPEMEDLVKTKKRSKAKHLSSASKKLRQSTLQSKLRRLRAGRKAR